MMLCFNFISERGGGDFAIWTVTTCDYPGVKLANVLHKFGRLVAKMSI